MTDDFSRAIAEIQGAHAELMSCYIAMRRTDEARAQYEAVADYEIAQRVNRTPNYTKENFYRQAADFVRRGGKG